MIATIARRKKSGVIHRVMDETAGYTSLLCGQSFARGDAAWERSFNGTPQHVTCGNCRRQMGVQG